ncbi:SDR family NAD(P)-dependent oxidoreductase [Psychromicrobium sp. YIM B11713]|uniref:SDR family NAD(P)-dependent oxidoreductase n=1 Tax=Psychromicrobium sp. YIM B11713 TaxID=3145233 RepID=UPI00374FBE61
MNYSGKTILITGASSGIGQAFAEKFASLGAKLVLVARSEDTMNALAATLKQKHGTEARVISLDLSVPGAAAELLKQIPAVDGLVNNAGFGTHGLVQDLDQDKVNQEIQLNCGALVDLTQKYLPGMLAKKDGLVINIASTAAFQPIPKLAVYGATKAFVLSFTQALWAELQGTGVRALAVCPGATSTNFFEVAGEGAAVGTMRSVDDVIKTTFKGLDKNAHTVVDGAMNGATAFFGRIAPRKLVMSAVSRMMSK